MKVEAPENRIPLGQGGMGKTYRVTTPEGDRVVKEFAPTPLLDGIYRIVSFGCPHPYSPNNPHQLLAIEAAAYRRHLGSAITERFSNLVSMLDAKPTVTGLLMPFIEGRPLIYEDEEIRSEVDKLAGVFRQAGMTAWNWRGFLGLLGWWPLKFKKGGFDNVLITPEGKAVAVDNEEGLPIINWEGPHLDDMSYPRFLKNMAKFGLEDLKPLAEIEEKYWRIFRRREASPTFTIQSIIKALEPEYLSETIDYLLENEKISAAEAADLREKINQSEVKTELRELMPHLIAHNLSRLLPHGVSSLARFGYTLGAKTVETVKGKKSGNHTWAVALFSLVPTVGGFAYLVDLLPTKDPQLTDLALESISHHVFQIYLSDLIESFGRRSSVRKTIQRIQKILVALPKLEERVRMVCEEQFGRELVNDLSAKLIEATTGEPGIDNDYPTKIYYKGQTYLVSWSEKKILVETEPGKFRRASREETDTAKFVLMCLDHATCKDFERCLMER